MQCSGVQIGNKMTSVRNEVTGKFVQNTLDSTMSKTVLTTIVILATAFTLALGTPAMEISNQDPGEYKLF